MELRAERDLFRQQASNNSMELTKKNRELVSKIEELEMLKNKYEEALAKLEDLNTSLISKLMAE